MALIALLILTEDGGFTKSLLNGNCHYKKIKLN